MRINDGVRCGLIVAALTAVAFCTSPAWAQPAIVGHHVPIELDTPRNYAGAGGQESVVRWSYRLHDPDATYLAIHFVNFDLGPGDYLIVSDESGKQWYTMSGRGKMGAGTFWARHIKGNTILLDLVVNSREGGYGFDVDMYAAGFVDLTSTVDKAICGTDDKENAKCYETSHPTEYDRGRAVCRVLYNGIGNCTGWLVSSDNYIITNEHCVTNQAEATNTDCDFMAEAPTCGTPNCSDCYPGYVYSGTTFIQDNANLDYAVLLINVQAGEPDPAQTYGYLELDNRVAIPDEEIYIIGHPGGRAKEFSIFSTHSTDAGGIAQVYSITEPACSGVGYSDVGYYADTEGGSSGSPVLARSSHKVIALHHCANCPNRGVPIHLIYPEVEQYLTPGPDGELTLDQANYGCADVIGMELRDGDLQGTGSHTVTATTPGGDSETVTVTETGTTTAIFTGSIATATGAIATEDGTLQVSPGEIISITYIDADDGQGGLNVPVVANANIDCTPPVISTVTTSTIEPRRAVVTITTNEPVVATVYYGTSCGSPTDVASSSGLSTSSDVELTEILDGETYFYTVEVTDEGGNSASDDNSGACFFFSTPDIPDFFTEQFETSDAFDLDGMMLNFIPDGSFQYYSACIEPVFALPTDPSTGTTLALSSNDSEAIVLTGGAKVGFYGVSYGTIHVGSNGYLTFDGGDTDSSESLFDHFDQVRISALFDSLDPSQAGARVSWEQFADRVVVTYENVPETSTTNGNTCQIELFFDGLIRIAYVGVDLSDCIVGLSEGNGEDPYFEESNLSALGDCGPRPPTAFSGTDATPAGHDLEITLNAYDDGLPDPPAALTYIITQLPAHGQIIDPNGGIVLAAPYALAGNGNVLTYSPSPLYTGPDSFEFKVDDGGVPPEGGESGVAIVVISIGGPSPVHEFNMDTDPGWTTEGAWEWGQPLGLGGPYGPPDPNSGYTGSNVYGYNLAGNYASSMSRTHLTSGALDCSAASAVTLRFQRWLGVEGPPYDYAEIWASNDALNWTLVWRSLEKIEDASWVAQEFDISGLADYEETVYVRFTMGFTDSSIEYCGWNLDDIALYGNVPLPGGGDMNCDGVTDFDDINPFVMALVDLPLYLALYPECNHRNGDLNLDGHFNFGDINPFVALLVGP